MRRKLDRFDFRIGPTSVALVKSTNDDRLWGSFQIFGHFSTDPLESPILLKFGTLLGIVWKLTYANFFYLGQASSEIWACEKALV